MCTYDYFHDTGDRKIPAPSEMYNYETLQKARQTTYELEFFHQQ